MARKETPDLLAELLAGPAEPLPPMVAPDAAPGKVERKPAARKPAEAKKAPSPAAKPAPASVAAEAPPPPTAWDYLVVSLSDYKGWRPRYINGQEVRNWMHAPIMHEYVGQLGDDGWELVAAASGKTLYGSNDHYQLFFKRAKK